MSRTRFVFIGLDYSFLEELPWPLDPLLPVAPLPLADPLVLPSFPPLFDCPPSPELEPAGLVPVPLVLEPAPLEVSVPEPLVEPVEPVDPLVPEAPPLVVPESDWNGRPFDLELASKVESRKGRPCGGFWVSNARPFGVELLEPERPWLEPEFVEELLFVPD